jgi:hypothetical protein
MTILAMTTVVESSIRLIHARAAVAVVTAFGTSQRGDGRGSDMVASYTAGAPVCMRVLWPLPMSRPHKGARCGVFGQNSARAVQSDG